MGPAPARVFTSAPAAIAPSIHFLANRTNLLQSHAPAKPGSDSCRNGTANITQHRFQLQVDKIGRHWLNALCPKTVLNGKYSDHGHSITAESGEDLKICLHTSPLHYQNQ